MRGMGQHPVMLSPDGRTLRAGLSPATCASAQPGLPEAVGGAAHQLEAVAFISNLDHGDFLPFHSLASFSLGFA